MGKRPCVNQGAPADSRLAQASDYTQAIHFALAGELDAFGVVVLLGYFSICPSGSSSLSPTRTVYLYGRNLAGRTSRRANPEHGWSVLNWDS